MNATSIKFTCNPSILFRHPSQDLYRSEVRNIFFPIVFRQGKIKLRSFEMLKTSHVEEKFLVT